MSDENKIDPAKLERYAILCEKIQSGVATELKYNPDGGSPKHLGTGNNLRAVDHSALVTLLVEKGLITWPEYQDALITAAETEVRRIEQVLTKQMGAKVRLGSRSEALSRAQEIETAMLANGETVPGFWLVCPECGTLDIDTKYNTQTKEFECPRGHTWPRPAEGMRVQ